MDFYRGYQVRAGANEPRVTVPINDTIDYDGAVLRESIFEFSRFAGTRTEVRGEFRATGYLPSYVEDFITLGLASDGEYL